MRILVSFFLVSLAALNPNPVLAQTASNPFASVQQDMNQEIRIAADRTTADFEHETATYAGNVVVKQGQMMMRSDALVIFAPNGKITRIEAQGHVVLTSPSGSAESAKAIYEVIPRLVTLTGGVVLTESNNVMRGEKLEVYLATGEAKLVAANGPDGKPGRVQGLFAPAQGGGSGN